MLRLCAPVSENWLSRTYFQHDLWKVKGMA